MLFSRPVLDGIAAGRVTVAFRRWRKPTVRTGGTLRTPVGLLRIETIERLDPGQISDRDARSAGFASAQEARASLAADDGKPVYRIVFRLEGEDPRVFLRSDIPSAAEAEEVVAKLARLDYARGTPWTDKTLRLIAGSPGTRAADLAARLDRDRDAFKADVRKLKELGLTESLDVGYRLSPRGQALLRSCAPSEVDGE
jgi:hypothetical protein